MIRYALRCDQAHRFDGWFASSAAFDEQQRAGQIVCPECGSTDVDKAMMAPSVATARAKDRVRLAAHHAMKNDALDALRKVREHVLENADYVGDRFAEEARKIHYNEVEPRGIYGEATAEEAKGLVEEGVAFQPLPPLPEDHN